MADKLMYITNYDTLLLICRSLLKRFETQLKPTKKNSMKDPKNVEPTNKKCYYKTLGSSLINSPLSTPL